MGTNINNIASAGAGLAALRPSPPAPVGAASAVQAPEAPKVLAPKPVAIHFDAAEVQQNLKEAVSFLNQQMTANNRGLGFQVDESLNQPVVTVRSTETGEVVRQIPCEVVVNVAHNIDRIKGLLFNGKS
jgi:flagellar protein FlaG